MDCGFRWSPRMLSILGIVFAAPLLVQFFLKLPYDGAFSSLLSAGKFAFSGRNGSLDSDMKVEGRDNPSLVRNTSPAVALSSLPPAASPAKMSNVTSQMPYPVSIAKMNELLYRSRSSPNSNVIKIPDFYSNTFGISCTPNVPSAATISVYKCR